MPPSSHIPIWSDDFLSREIRETPEYRAILDDPAPFDTFRDAAQSALCNMLAVRGANETITMERAIRPILSALGWPDPLEAQSITARERVDLVLFAADSEREDALAEQETHRIRHAVGLVECKQWRRDFDARGSGGRATESGAEQTCRYLLNAGADSDGRVAWAITTNATHWRLYGYHTRPRTRFQEFDLYRLLDPKPQGSLFIDLDEKSLHQLRVAFLLFRRDSWTPVRGERESFLQRLLAEGRRSEERLAADLSNVIFQNVFPDLVKLFWRKQPDASPEEIREAAFTFLYRLLFICYSEDRGLLPVENMNYQEYSLRHERDAIAKQRGRAAAFSTVSTRIWNRLSTLREMIDEGDDSIGLPAYNGGLFEPFSFVDTIQVPDAELVDVIHSLSHNNGRYISYRDLSIQQLGSIYEKLLERTPRRNADGETEVAIHPYARKDSGSYYTPQELVDLIVEQTLRPLVDERIAAFRSNPSSAPDPAEAILELKVLDPAMGSGHFLITALDWLTNRVLELIDPDEEQARNYKSPLRNRLDRIKEELAARDIEASDQVLVQRLVLKRCIYGVDKNPMAVQLAKVALWLHTFTPGIPLPFIDHRLRTGDALLGTWISNARKYLEEWSPDYITSVLEERFAARIGREREDMEELEQSLDLDIDKVLRLSTHFDTAVERNLGYMREIPNLTTGLGWLSAGLRSLERRNLHQPLIRAVGGNAQRAGDVLFADREKAQKNHITDAFFKLEDRAIEIAARERILHWELTFLNIWPEGLVGRGESDGGFDAVIGNPPWDRIKLQEVEWWAAREHPLATARTAAIRRKGIARLRSDGDPLADDFDKASAQAAELSRHVRANGDYPLLGTGDINLYSLFVERAMRLIKPNGVIGLLTPSGIYADKTAARFFKSVSTTGRVGGIFDFENRRSNNPDADSPKWFPDVDTRFKFCALIFGGPKRRFDATRCGFFLDGQADLHDANRVFSLAPSDFARINPNTGTAPILRSPRDATIVSEIYRRHPVLVDRSDDEARKAWPVKYVRMLDMTNQSYLFRTPERLEADGAYRTAPNRYRRGTDTWLPLYQGRMIHHFDHRANGVEFNPESVRSPYLSVPVSDGQHADPLFAPGVQYWVDAVEVREMFPEQPGWTIGFRGITNATNERTMIAAIVPWAGYGNSLPLLMPDPELDANSAACLVANLSSMALDYVAKRKAQGTNLNWFTVEQLPVIAPDDYDTPFGNASARDLIAHHVLRLSYTSHDLAQFARDLGHQGQPFTWNRQERRQLRARLDALYFHLYGLSEDDAAYVLGQFPVLERNENREHRRYLTKELVLGHYRALAAGDTETDVIG